MIRRAALALAALAWAAVASANPQAPAYDPEDLARVQSRYTPGILSNLREVILPRLDPADAARLAGVAWDFPLTHEQDPFAFAAGDGTVVMSAASILFLDDISIAAAWLNGNGYSLASLTDYVTMLKYGRLGDRPPRPLDALCIPADALDDPAIADTAGIQFDVAMVFIMLHELGHIRHAHRGNDPRRAALSRAEEAEADRFALEGLRRLGASPAPMIPIFTVWAHMALNRGDVASDADLAAHLAADTHPLLSSRIADIAGMLEGDPVMGPLAGRILSRIVATLDTPEVQQVMAVAGATALRANLAPRRPDEFLGTPCGYAPDGQAFSGPYDGWLTIEGEAFDVSLVLRRKGEVVRGASSYGAGTTEIDGLVEDGTLDYRWSLGGLSGRGRLTLGPDGALSGTWGNGASATDGGRAELRRRDPP